MSDGKLSYEEAMHGVQTGIAFELSQGSDCASPKHLRVGIDSAMVSDAALAKLLIEKGIITETEYADAVTKEANLELERVEKRVNERYGGQGRVKLR